MEFRSMASLNTTTAAVVYIERRKVVDLTEILKNRTCLTFAHVSGRDERVKNMRCPMTLFLYFLGKSFETFLSAK